MGAIVQYNGQAEGNLPNIFHVSYWMSYTFSDILLIFYPF